MSFIDVMLSEAEKEQFLPENILLKELFHELKTDWEKDYSWIEIQLIMEEHVRHKSAKDIFRVIFDNLFLNSIQQNDDKNALQIMIEAEKKGRFMEFTYSDSGRGLVPKYIQEPMRILDVHETSRKGGHGIGMWIVNNTIIGTGGEITEIDGKNGFRIKFRIGEKV